MKTCLRCDRRVKARGLCSTHYNATLPNRHRKIIKTCDACGTECVKEARAQRYAHTFCSLLCRDYFQYGPLSSTYPKPAATPRRADHARPFPPIAGQFVAGNCFDCGSSFVTLSRTGEARYCSPQCERRVSARRRRAREYDAVGEYRYTEVVHLYIRQGRVCAYCKRPVTGLPEPEHVIPLSRGGRNDLRNLVAACHLCNSDKGDMTPTEWQLDRKRRGLPPIAISGPAFLHLMDAAPVGMPHRTLVRRAA